MNGVIQFQVILILKVLLAALLGGTIGYFRRRKRAGIRTMSLIAIGSALFTLISVHGFSSGDPARVAAGIVTGIGFIGAGIIWKQTRAVRGITTASAIWVAAAVGMSAALGMWIVALFSTILIVVILQSKIDEPYTQPKKR